MFKYLLLITALAISAVAAYYSIAGLVVIFASAVLPVAIMASVLEVGKLVAATFLHNHWDNIKWWLKTYLSVAVVLLMFITSMGIFGFLSKAHIEQTASVGDNTIKIERIEQQIERQQRVVNDADTVLVQLDQAVQTLIDYDRIRGPNGSIAVRQSQKEERDQLAATVNEAELKIDELQIQKSELQSAQNVLEAEVGPLKYVAELVYGSSEKSLVEDAVRWVILIIVAVFDPLAIALLLAFNSMHRKKEEPAVVELNGLNDFDWEYDNEFGSDVDEQVAYDSEQDIRIGEAEPRVQDSETGGKKTVKRRGKHAANRKHKPQEEEVIG